MAARASISFRGLPATRWTNEMTERVGARGQNSPVLPSRGDDVVTSGAQRPGKGACVFSGRRIDSGAHRRDPVRREPATPRVLPDDVGVRCDVNAVDLVVRDVTLNPLDVRA